MRLQSLVVIIAAVLLGSCRAEKPNEAPGPAPVENVVETPVLNAQSTVDYLRVRSEPYLDSTQLGRLMKGQAVTPESRTQWTQTIDSLEAHWFFVRAEGFSGWVFGGYLAFQTPDAGSSVPVDPSLGVPDPLSSEVDSRRDESYLNPESLPDLRIPTIGMETAPDTFSAMDGVISYDPLFNQLFIWFSDHSESRLNELVTENINTQIRVVAKSPGGKQYEVSHRLRELRRFDDLYQSNAAKNMDAVLVPFRSYAPILEGSWEFYAFIADENWPIAGGVGSIKPPAVSLVTSPNPNPFIHTPNSKYSVGSHSYAFGWDVNRSSSLQVVLYHDTEQRDEKSDILLRPIAAKRVFPDKKGFWSTDFLLSKDFPKGRYWVAVGETIESPKQLAIFVTSLQLQ